MKYRGTRAARPKKPRRGLRALVAIVAAAAIAAGVVTYNRSADPNGALPVHLPTTPQSYLGVYDNTFPASYTGLTGFSRATGTDPDIAMTYSGWYVPFPERFADTAASNGVVPLVQMDPTGVSVAAIAAGKFDPYLSEYAEAVRVYGHPVILSFGHEMNGTWYSWGYRNTSPKVFVAAWRHIVTLFRALHAKNVTWMWTVNIINDTRAGRIPSPAAWWPGHSYVDWVGIDGYYLKPNWQFAPLFGPTIFAVGKLTSDPILIAETGAITTVAQPAKIADLFAGIHKYGLLGFVWFDGTNSMGQDFSVTGPAAFAAFRRGGHTFSKPGS
jgi:hypothetical protein